MSKIVVWMQMSLDGKTQGPSGGDDGLLLADRPTTRWPACAMPALAP